MPTKRKHDLDARNFRCLRRDRISRSEKRIIRDFRHGDARSDPTSSRCQISRAFDLMDERRGTCFLNGRTEIPAGGARRDRTDDLLLAKQALSQLSYGPGAGCLRAMACRAEARGKQPSLAARAKAGGPGKI